MSLPMQIFWPRKKQNDFELEDISSRLNTAIFYRRDFNLTEFSNALLNIGSILPAWILLISLCFHDFPVFSRLLPENRVDTSCVRNKPKCGYKRGVENSQWSVSTRARIDKHKTKFDKEM